MRLGQLSRQLNLDTTDIVNFLAENNIEVKDHPNVKLDENAEQMVLEKFAESKPKEPVERIEASEQLSVDNEPVEISSDALLEEPGDLMEKELIDELTVDIPEVEPEESANIEEAADSEEETPESEEEIEVIKAPKIELPGLKVVGKIDLPEPKAPKPEADQEPKEEEEKEESIPKVRLVHHSKRNSRPRLTPEQLEEKRLRNRKAKEKRIREAEERARAREIQRLKDIKAEHYKKKLAKPGAKATANKKKASAKPKQSTKQKPQPKSLLGKFWRWLNT
ncbi:hypothetical protein [Marinoscillum sp.]|uniref:hypothetical protein n=1 Tax=Marinoscillum sp. TaxID=2024838 RepID=UPI003BA8E75A